MNEFERIEEIRRRLMNAGVAGRQDIRIAIGDDCAVLHASARAQVLSVDSAVEGVHFRLAFGSPERLGRRAVVAAASDLGAMGARPRCALSALTLPGDQDDDVLMQLVDGMARAARELSMPIVGGNLTSGARLTLSTTVMGELEGEPLTRSGARPGDQIFVSGAPGCAALGLRVLLARPEWGGLERFRPYVNAWLDPRAQIEEGLALTGHATACIDVSDGFAQDLGHLLKASSVGARIELSALPQPDDFAARAEEIGSTHAELALGGGEDYLLIFTAPAGDSVAESIGTPVGECTEDLELRVLGPDGKELQPPAGYQHSAD